MKTDLEDRLRASMQPLLRLPAPERRTSTRPGPSSRWRLVAAMSTAVAVAAAMVAIILAGRLAGQTASSHTPTPPPIGASATPSASPTPGVVSGTGSWQISATSMGDLSGVACVSSGDCWAVGTPITNGGFGSGTTTGGGVESYSGGTWTSVPSPSPTGSAWTDLSAVACASASDCWFVGDYGKESEGPDQPLVEGDDGGAWSVVSPPLPTGAVEGALSSVACQSTGDCWAVGYFSDTNGEPYQPLIEHYSAGAWTVTAGDLPAGDDNGMLSAVSCAGASDCWAVGEGSPQISDSTSALIEHYEGTGWSVAPSPAPTGASGVGAGTSLSGVTCVGVSECWAVGDQTTGGDKGGVQEPLIEQYTVGGWTIVDSPTPDDDGLVGVTCAGATECWAVGNGSVSDSGDDEPLIESYAGSSWTVVSSGTISIPSWLSAVSCSGSRDCWAVGEGVVDHYTG